MTALRELSGLWKEYKGRRWFQGIVWTIVAIIIALLIAIYSACDLNTKYNSEMAAHNKTQELLKQNTATLNHYIQGEFSKIYSMDEEKLSIVSNPNISAQQSRVLFDYHKDYAESDYGKAIFYFDNKSYNESIEAISRAIILDPDNVEYLIFKGYLFYLMGDYENALDFITLPRLKNSSQAIPWFIRADLLDKKGDYRGSLDVYQEYYNRCQLEIDCNYAIIGILSMDYLIGNDADAEKWIKKLNMTYLNVEQKTPLWLILNQKAEIYFADKKYIESNKMFEEAINSLVYDKTLISPVENSALAIEISKRLCWVKLNLDNLTNIGYGTVKLCIITNPETGKTIYQSQYDEEKQAFVSTSSMNTSDIKQYTIRATFQ